MAKSDFENLKVYQMSENLADEKIKPLVDNLAPMLNAYLRSIGPASNKSIAS